MLLIPSENAITTVSSSESNTVLATAISGAMAGANTNQTSSTTLCSSCKYLKFLSII